MATTTAKSSSHPPPSFPLPTTTPSPSGSPAPIPDRLSFLFQCLKGTVVHIELMDSRRLEGIWDRVFVDEKSQKESFSLTLVRCWPAPSTSTTATTPNTTTEHAFITAPLDKIKFLGTSSDPNGSLNFTEATGDSFGTDSEISEQNSLSTNLTTTTSNRTLSPWMTTNTTNTTVIDTNLQASLESTFDRNKDHQNSKWNQFEANKKLFGVETAFNENDYTTPLENVSAKSLRNAERLAKEIECSFSSGTTNIHRRDDRGSWRSSSAGAGAGDDSQIDEEDLYGAVIRENQHQPAAALMAAISSESIEQQHIAAAAAASPAHPPSLLNPAALDFVPGMSSYASDYVVEEAGFSTQFEPLPPAVPSTTAAIKTSPTTSALNPSASVFNPFAKEFVP